MPSVFSAFSADSVAMESPEHEYGDHRERQGGEFQERHTAAGFGVATVGEGRHGRVHERVEESGEGGDAAHHGHDAEND